MAGIIDVNIKEIKEIFDDLEGLTLRIMTHILY
jgi:hypothetical protein